jgi:MEMO1 family protein
MLEPHQDKAIRRAAVAGLFYPADPVELKSDVEELLANSKIKHRPGRIRALIVPHAGYVYSGPVAAKAFALLRAANYYAGRVAIIGPAHKIWIRGIAVPSVRAFATPLGKIPLDTAVIEEIAALPSAAIDDKPHANEHALEVELPFLQTVLGSARIVPLLVGSATPTEVAEVLSRLWDEDTLIVVSSDLSHFLRGPARLRPLSPSGRRRHRTPMRPLLWPAQSSAKARINYESGLSTFRITRARPLVERLET